MEKITSKEQMFNVYFADALLKAQTSLGIEWGDLNNENFWVVREQCRINDGTYTPISIVGDDKMRFLHVSIDDPAKVSYTKNEDKGEQDIQTRTTLAAYCEKFGLDITTARTVARVAGIDDSMTVGSAPVVMNPVARGFCEAHAETRQTKTSVREKLGMIQDLIDEVLADLG